MMSYEPVYRSGSHPLPRYLVEHNIPDLPLDAYLTIYYKVMGTEADRIDEEICKEASNFTKIFYDAMDRKRDKINYLYCDNEATLVWNGNAVTGCDNIFKFISSLPETDHHLVSVDVQRVNTGFPNSPDLLTVMTAGSVTLGGIVHGFTHTFILMVEDGKYKVRSERFRYLD